MRFAKTLLLLAALLAPASIASAQQEVDIQLESFGVESFFRPGDFTGIRLRLVSNLREPVNTQVVWEVPEGLGDIAEHTRIPVALTPGVPTNTWLYAKLLPDISLETVWTVRVYRDDDGERGEELGSIKISPRTAQIPPQPVGTAEALFGVIGNAGPHSMGLDDYNVTRSGSRATPITAHEFTVVAPGINAGSLPDRWEGLDSFSFLVWTTDTPSALSTASGRALRDWVQRGGHLAIVLSPSSNDWNLGSIANSPIHDLLPQTLDQRITHLEEVGERRADHLVRSHPQALTGCTIGPEHAPIGSHLDEPHRDEIDVDQVGSVPHGITVTYRDRSNKYEMPRLWL